MNLPLARREYDELLTDWRARQARHRLDPETPDDGNLLKWAADSMSAIGLLWEIEEKFGIRIPPTTINAQIFSSPDALWDAISDQSSEAGAANTADA